MKTNINYFAVVALAAMGIVLASCQTEGGGNSTGTGKGRCSAENTAKLIKAIDILGARGFKPGEILSIVGKSAGELGCKRDFYSQAWYKYFNEKYPQPSDGIAGDSSYNIKTGALYDYANPVSVAQSMPSCYRNGNPERDCNPTYHPMFGDDKTYPTDFSKPTRCGRDPGGNRVCDYQMPPRSCRMTADWKRACRLKKNAVDFCWTYAKGDIPMIPDSNVGGMFNLAKAKRTDEAKMTPKAPKVQGAYCDPIEKFGG
ncbi:hypothetical protein [Rhizobium sp. L1K21]|uniref:hypothetical protein n=1 Tax=Rhizobium sp. L1K21 TaxID=2954933 RepID=UPI002092609F|nr:hypothetical protein [Rhizobium sp. L1K21]MCO6185953.1 hypothetical protein [Rhizobium sp. L1K21]